MSFHTGNATNAQTNRTYSHFLNGGAFESFLVDCYANQVNTRREACVFQKCTQKNVLHCTHWPFRGNLKMPLHFFCASTPFSKEISVSMCTRPFECRITRHMIRYRATVIVRSKLMNSPCQSNDQPIWPVYSNNVEKFIQKISL